jgi:RES domain-containing protein
LYGGRWNRVGDAVVYCSGSRPLAALELLAHLPMAVVPNDLKIAEIHVSEKIKRKTFDRKLLPTDWRSYPAPDKLAELGSEWLQSKSSLLLDVPSSLVDGEMNTLINPLHWDFKNVKISEVKEFSFDSRLLRR